MEHRWKKRIETSLDVLVHGRDGLTLHGRTRDISVDGAFIWLEQQSVSLGSSVQLETPHCDPLSGWVVYTEDEGIGVMFRALGSRERRFIEHMIEHMISKSG